MSWFDTSSFANIAKSALKEAQKTIDKALDIKGDDINPVPANTPVDTNSDDFFGSWGVTSTKDSVDAITTSPAKQNKASSSLWGSFAGSFFESPLENDKNIGALGYYIDSNNDFKRSKLVLQEDEIEALDPRLLNIDIETTCESDKNESISTKKKDTSANHNRLSVISTETDKRSSESVEILSNTECTTSPDSDALSSAQSLSTSSGIRLTSDSVEIIVENLTSPSSVEILQFESVGSPRESQQTDEFISPLDSPEELSSTERAASVEVLQDDHENNISVEDAVSCVSISGTTATAVLDSNPNIQRIYQKGVNMVSDESSDASKPGRSEPITRPPARSTLHLPFNQDSNMLKMSNVIDIPEANKLDRLQESNDEGCQSDKTLIASDNFMDSSTDTSTTTDSNLNSSYLKNMLADAMVEKNSDLENSGSSETVQHHRETSPLSSESSNMVKIGSDQTSGHTSGDELETTTSSDIEIISSPNGDTSSTKSRQSPSKISIVKHKSDDANVDVLLGKMTFRKMKGHNRELSEASSISDDSEIDRLIKRLTEVTEILELREAKLIEIGRKYIELQEANIDLKQQLCIFNDKQVETSDLTQVTEEYTQRLSALERKFQQAIRDKDLLRKQLDHCKQEATLKLNKSEIDSILLEKDEIIKELREEGEKLSKQQLQHSNIIKKLRTKEKDHEGTIKYLKSTVEDLTSETERLKRSLAAKEEVERSQIEAVHNLTAKKQKIRK